MPRPWDELPPLALLLTFETVARLGNLTRAAGELGVTQPAVSHQIRQLEQHLGTPLFMRVHRGVVLTPAGEGLHQSVADSFDSLNEAVRAIRHRRPASVLQVATDFGFAAFWLLPRLAEFRLRHPAIDVRVITAQRGFDLVSESMDVAVVFGQPPFPHALAKRLYWEVVYPVCSPWLLQSLGEADPEAALRHCPRLVLGGEDSGRWLSWQGWLQACGISTAPDGPELTFDNYMLLLQAAIAGQGVALGWHELVRPMLDAGQLVRYLPREARTRSGYHLLIPRDRQISPSAFAFRDWVLSAAGDADGEG